ncbi:MAG TPA: hypothetical protein VK527_02645 [Candidatus Limnocylindrales bacterium]|nr:hypothetical protein [Candidatus Limnocylindrales bacterium]
MLLTGARLCFAADPAAPPDSSSQGSFYALRTESTLDRDALEAAGIRRPSRLAYDSDGNLHVLDAETRRVVKLDPRGRVLYEIGGYGSDETSLELPVDIAVDRDQSLLILDRGRGAVVAFDRAGRFLGQRPFQGAAAEESRRAGARILLDRFGKLWLLSVQGRDLVPLDDRLGPARATRYLVPEDSVGAPTAATVSLGGEVWTYDAARGALLRFAASGRMVRTIALHLRPERVSVSDLASDRTGYVFAADPVGQRILVLDAEGMLILDRPLGGDRVRWRPGALAIGPRGQIAVADPERAEIQILLPDRSARP